ncbi:hypothetical protein K6Q96_12335 [Grimontia kaedaensis]|uniref:Uncharacterized protein n=1 Tax=Grimontia kaedaensis TaxID=2872157 RepID=A0ABY4WQ02_9GAMM|nr:hypothetical protein [Grimontia kaedaensis]USH01666.1 hypothetical protein K6Q96_12335 [Grimontia kaedaensis]
MRKAGTVLITLALAGLGVWLLGDTETETPVQDLATMVPEKETASSSGSEPQPLPLAKQIEPEQMPDEPLPVMEIPEAMTAQFSMVAQTFEQELHYPPYSQPILSSDSPYLTPNRFAEVEMPILDGQESAVLSLDKYRFFYPEAVPFKVKSSLPVLGMRYSLLDIGSREEVASGNSENADGEMQPDEAASSQLRLKVTVRFEGGSDVLTADISYANPVAFVIGAEPAYTQQADWMIPISIDARKAGLYRLRANLYREDGRPVAVLTEKQKLSEGQGEILLKAHQSVFSGQSGAYSLKDIQLERMSGRPGEETQYGVSKVGQIELGELDADILNDLPYQPSEQERQQLQFLKHLAGEA